MPLSRRANKKSGKIDWMRLSWIVRLLTLTTFLVSFLVTSGCASRGEVIDDVMLSLATIKQVVGSALPNGLASRSTNGREFYSQFYDPYDPLKERFDNARKRSVAKVTILGDRRPYDIQVEVIIERRKRTRKGPVYVRTGFDKKAEEALALRIKLRLSKAKDSRDFIDDFRAF